jgi:hypothetical protein
VARQAELSAGKVLEVYIATTAGVRSVSVCGVVEVCLASVGEGCGMVVFAFVYVTARPVRKVVEVGTKSAGGGICLKRDWCWWVREVAEGVVEPSAWLGKHVDELMGD